MDINDANSELLSQEFDETRSSDSEEDEDTVREDTRYVRGNLERQRSSSTSIDKGSDGMAGDTDNFDDEVQRMDLNIETLNEQGKTITL